MEEHIKNYLDTVSSVVKGEPHQQLLTTFLGKMIDLYTVMTYHFADAMAEVDRVAEDEGLKQSLRRYAIESGAIMERVYRKEMELPIENMKQFLDGILHIYDEGRTAVKMGDLFGIVTAAEERVAEKEKFRGSLTTKKPIKQSADVTLFTLRTPYVTVPVATDRKGVFYLWQKVL